MRYDAKNKLKPKGRATLDAETKDTKLKIPAAEQLLYLSKKFNLGLIATGLEYRRARKGRGKLTLEDFVDFDVLNTPAAERDRFISDRRHWSIVSKICDMSYHALTEDKWLASLLMESSGIPNPEILALFDASERKFPGTKKLSNSEEFGKFLDGCDFPLFGKSNLGIGSFGAFVISDWDGELITTQSNDTYSLKEFVQKWIASDSYLLQKKLTNHKEMLHLSDDISTIRIGFLRDEGYFHIPACCIKIPSSNNFADNFWRPGNLIGAVDSHDGSITRLRKRKDGRVVECTSDDLNIDLAQSSNIPLWDEVISITQECAKLFHFASYGTLDIAITDAGPTVIEVNTGGAFELFQISSGTGFLSDEVLAFFRKFGVDV